MIDVALAQTASELAEACGLEPGYLCELVFDLTGSKRLAGFFDAANPVLTSLLIVLAAWIVNRIVRKAIDRGVARLVANHNNRAERAAQVKAEARAADSADLAARLRAEAQDLVESSARNRERTETLGAVLRSTASIAIWTIALLMVLGEFDINLGPLIAGAGIVGVALGFGAQSLVKDFLSGTFMLIEDQYGVGDIVDVGEATGIVEHVSLRVTQIRDINGTLWFVPNGEIRRVGNKSQEWARTVLDIDVAYDTDIDRAMDVIKRVADEVWEEEPEHATIVAEPEMWGVERFGENAVTIRLAMKVEPAEQFTTARLVRARIKDALDTEGIEIPFPQRTVWLKGLPSSPDSGH